MKTKKMYYRGCADDLRARGFTVAVHNDYRQNGKSYTFWLLTRGKHPSIQAFKGEGETDWEALDKIRAQVAQVDDTLHHAPACDANHYCGKRAPVGPCTCGADNVGTGEA